MKVERHEKREETIHVTLSDVELAKLIRKVAKIPPEFDNCSLLESGGSDDLWHRLTGVWLKFYKRDAEPT